MGAIMSCVSENCFQSENFKGRQFHFLYHYDSLSVNYNVFTHWHEEIEILYFKEGTAYAICNKDKFLCKPGDILFINSYCFHSMERIDESCCSYYCFSVALDIFQNNVFSEVDLPAYFLANDEKIGRILESCMEEYDNELPGYQTTISSYMTSVLVCFGRQSSKTSADTQISVGQSNKIRKALVYINEHLTEKIYLDELCELTELSRSRFSSIFKAFVGKSLVDYINQMRCQYARNLFLSGKYTVAECAEKAGFNNLSYFARKYRQVYGTTISQDKFC